MPSQTTSILTIAGVTLVAGFVAYAAYFDYKRRNDVAFRKNLKKQKKRVDKSIASSKTSEAVSTAELRQALEQMKKEPIPGPPEQRENFFMSQVAAGEQLSAQGPEFTLPAAMSFYRALRVYPSPVELMAIYQKTVPEHIFKLVIELTSLDVKDRVEGYYEHFPPKSLGVTIESRPNPSTGAARKVLVLTKDVKEGEVIYKENPVVGVLDLDVQAAGTHCSHCMRAIVEPSKSIKPSDDPLNSVYCSEDCQLAAKSQSQSLLFSLDRPLPADIPIEPITPAHLEARRKAQTLYADYIKKNGKAAPLLVGRFIARQVALETAKLIPSAPPQVKSTNDFVDADEGDYLLADHVERLRYLELQPVKEEIELITEVLQSVLPGLESFVTDERYAVLLGKMAYNSYGVTFDGGRNDKPEPTDRPEDAEKTRTPLGTQRQIGSAIYTVASYLTHSCGPNARPSFNNGTSELHLIANRDLKKGDELTVSYVDSTVHENESALDARRRRRIELARGWRFACGCDKCAEEAKELGLDQKADTKDESKLEETYSNYEKNEGAL